MCADTKWYKYPEKKPQRDGKYIAKINRDGQYFVFVCRFMEGRWVTGHSVCGWREFGSGKVDLEKECD